VNSKRNTDFLPMPNGALELMTLTLRNYQPDEYVISTRVFPFEFQDAVQADIDEVNGVLAQMQPDDEALKYMKSVMVLMLLDRNFKAGWVFALGPSGTGKTTWILMMKALLGKLAHRSSAQCFKVNPRADNTGADSNLAQASGKRAWFVEEFADGLTLDIDKIKEITGGDDLRARSLYGQDGDIMMVATLVMASNTLPSFSTLVGLPKRLSILPFSTVFQGDAHRDFKEQLKTDCDLTRRWRGALLHILARHYQEVFKPEILDNPAVQGIPQPPLVARATLDRAVRDRTWNRLGLGADRLAVARSTRQ
jgi:phage/plasmid-associated DNA primase